MFYLNSYSIDELGIKMRNLYILFMVLCASLYYVVKQENIGDYLLYTLPVIYILLIVLIYVTKNSFGKRKQDFIKINTNPIILWSSFFIFLISPLMLVYSIQFMPGVLYQQILISLLVNFIIGYISFKIIIPGELSRNHASEYRQTAVTTRILEKENTGKTTPSIKMETKLKINTDDMEDDKKSKESEIIIENLLKEQDELMKVVKK